jgi:hypothetical protein
MEIKALLQAMYGILVTTTADNLSLAAKGVG